MRTDTNNFTSLHNSETKRIRVVVEIAFDTAATDLWYFTTHSDAATPNATNTKYGTVYRVSGISQRYNPRTATTEIGSLSVQLLDVDSAVSLLLQTKLNSSKSIRRKRVRVYVGYEGLVWADYSLVQTQLVHKDLTYDGKNNTVTISCRDIQREERTNIFTKRHSTLRTNLAAADTQVDIDSTYDITNFKMLSHSEGFSVDPGAIATDISFSSADNSINSVTTDLRDYLQANQKVRVYDSASNDGLYTVSATAVTATKAIVTTSMVNESAGATIRLCPLVGYIKVYKSKDEYEIIKYTEIDAVNNRFKGCTRGMFNTVALDINKDTSLSQERQPKIEEYIYLEMPLIKLIYAIMTGALLNQAGEELPTLWHEGLSPSYVAQADFTSIGPEWYSVTDDRKEYNFNVRFDNPSEQNSKTFIERELLLMIGAFRPIYANGELGLKLGVGVLSRAGNIALLDKRCITSYSALTHDYEEVRNDITFNWAWDTRSDSHLRSRQFVDNTSINVYEYSEPYTMSFKGLHGSIKTLSTLTNQFAAVRDRYAGPPKKFKVSCFSIYNGLEVGEVVRVQLEQVRDYTNLDNIGVVDLDSTFEIQRVSVEWFGGEGAVSFDLFGSSMRADSIPINTTAGNVLSDSYYTTNARDLATYYTGTISGGAVTTSGTLAGSASLSDTNARYYYLGDLTVNSAATMTLTNNVTLLIRGYLTIDGTITTSGQGYAGATAPASPSSIYDNTQGTQGILGPVVSAGGVTFPKGRFAVKSNAGAFTQGTYRQNSLSYYRPEWDGTTLSGVPTSLIGTSGCSGTPAYVEGEGAYSVPGNGGASGGGLMIICRGIVINGKIITSGADGATGAAVRRLFNYMNVGYAGSGAGGAPGGCVIFLDGNNLNIPVINTSNFKAAFGACPIPAGVKVLDTIGEVSLWNSEIKESAGAYSFYSAQGYADMSGDNGAIRVQHITDNSAPEEDQADIAPPATAIALAEDINTPNSLTDNLTTITVTLTPPSDNNYDYSIIYVKRSTKTEWDRVGPTFGDERALPPATMDGGTWDVQARPVSKKGIEAPSGPTNQITVTSATGGVNLANGNYLSIDKTSYTDNTEGLWIGKSASGDVQLYLGDYFEHFKWDPATGKAVIKGGIQASWGTIGGWDITSQTIELADLVIDGNWGRIQSGPDSSNYIRFDQDVFQGVTTAHGTAFELRTDGTAHTIAGWKFDGDKFYNAAATMELDGATSKLQCGPSGSTYVRVSPSGITGVDTTLGTTFNLPTDGSNPTFSSGIIDKTVFKIYTSGVIKTADDPSVTGGVLINSTGVKGYSSTPTLNFHLDATDGSISSKLGDIGGWSINSTSLYNSTNIGLDASNKALWINSSTYGAQGIQLQYNSGTPRAYIGDGASKFLEFDGTDVNIGHDSNITGAKAYGNTDFYYETDFQSLDGFYTTTSGTGAVQYYDTTTRQGLELHTQANLDACLISKGGGISVVELTFAKDSKIKTKISFSALATNVKTYFARGRARADTPAADDYYGFKIDGATLYGVTCNGATETATPLMTISSATGYELEAVFDSGTSVGFYVNGTLQGTNTTNLPTGADGHIFSYSMYNTATATAVKCRFSYVRHYQVK